jgi:hypothetical protein
MFKGIDTTRLKSVKPSKKSRIEITENAVIVFGGRDETYVRCVFPLDSASKVFCSYIKEGKKKKDIVLTFLPAFGHLNCSLHNIRLCNTSLIERIDCYAYVFCSSKDEEHIQGWL